MPLGTNNVTAATVPNFIPQLWSDEIIAAYKANVTARNLVRVLNHNGKKGNSIKLPTPTRGDATAKAASTQVTLIAHGTDTGVTISINNHYEYSRLIEDFADVQALESLRRFYTDDAGYAIGKRVDSDVILATAGGTLSYTISNNTIAYSGSTYPTLYEGDGTTWDVTATITALTDAGARSHIQRLDDQNVPFANRFILIPPVVKNTLLGLARFTENAFTGESGSGSTLRNGLIGNMYAMPVYVSTQAPIIQTSAAVANQRLCLMFQQDAAVLVEQLGLRVQKQYKQEWLADLLTADTIYGTKQLRSTAVVPFVVPA